MSLTLLWFWSRSLHLPKDTSTPCSCRPKILMTHCGKASGLALRVPHQSSVLTRLILTRLFLLSSLVYSLQVPSTHLSLHPPHPHLHPNLSTLLHLVVAHRSSSYSLPLHPLHHRPPNSFLLTLHTFFSPVLSPLKELPRLKDISRNSEWSNRL